MRLPGVSTREKCAVSQVMKACMVLSALLLTFCPVQAWADGEDIARDLANPFASLWNVVNQINFNQLKETPFPYTETQFNWNLQPVMPVPLNRDFNIINRPVIPYYKSPYVDATGTVEFASGIGDMQLATLLSPNKSEGLIYGLGATFIAPTARDSKHIGQGLWQAGPAAGLFYVSKQFVAGVFPQHWQAVSGVDNEHPATRFTNLQYGISYLPTPKLTILSSANILIDWTKDEANRWTVPLSLGVSYLFHFGKTPVSIGINLQKIVKHPADYPHQESIVRLTITPVLPSPFAGRD